ncbi:hypothetical protein VTO73DRAFT_13379 [Trametes versicolor]
MARFAGKNRNLADAGCGPWTSVAYSSERHQRLSHRGMSSIEWDMYVTQEWHAAHATATVSLHKALAQSRRRANEYRPPARLLDPSYERMSRFASLAFTPEDVCSAFEFNAAAVRAGFWAAPWRRGWPHDAPSIARAPRPCPPGPRATLPSLPADAAGASTVALAGSVHLDQNLADTGRRAEITIARGCAGRAAASISILQHPDGRRPSPISIARPRCTPPGDRGRRQQGVGAMGAQNRSIVVDSAGRLPENVRPRLAP